VATILAAMSAAILVAVSSVILVTVATNPRATAVVPAVLAILI
jgi:hypothetical protein